MDTTLLIIQIIVSSGLIVAIYNNYTQIKLQNKLKLTEINENRFRSILIFMYIMLHPEQISLTSECNNDLLKSISKDKYATIVDYYRNVIEVNKANLYLYADEKLIQLLDNFLKSPNDDNYINVAKYMKNNLWK